jgi:hypothetical protein
VLSDSLNNVRSAWVRSLFRFRQYALLLGVLGLIATGAADLPAEVQSGSSGSGSHEDPANPVTISGRVVNALSGLPVPRALVRFRDRAMLTTHDGKFEFGQIVDHGINLQVSKPGFYSSAELGAPGNLSLPASKITGPLELRLYPEAIFTGTVTAPDGDPLPQILVSARRSVFDGSGQSWIPVAQMQTDSHGRFRLPVQPGDYKLESMYVPRLNGTNQVALPAVVPSESLSGTSNFIHIRSGEEQHFDLHPTVSRAYTVTATFDSDIDRGFPRMKARPSNGATISLPVNLSHSGDSGAARIELPSGTYTLIASVMSADGMKQGESTVTVTDRDVSGLTFHLAPVPSVPVELLVDGSGTSDNTQPNLRQLGLTLENVQSDPDILNGAIPLSMQRDRAMVFTVSPGAYRLRARSNGAWYIRSASYGASDLLQQEIVIGPGAGGTPIRITVSDQTGSLQGTCGINGAPAECLVYLIPTTPSAEMVFIQQADSQGIYSYAHLPPGSYQAVAFERRHSADYSDPATLVPFATHVRAVTINAGEKPTLDLDAVSEAEMSP